MHTMVKMVFKAVYWANVGLFFHEEGKKFVPVTGTDFTNKNDLIKYVYNELSITLCDL